MSRLNATLRARLGARVRAQLERRGQATRGHEHETADLRQQLAALGGRLGTVEGELQRLRADQDLWSRPFHADMSIDRAWRRHPGARQVFAAFHLPACDTCAVRFDETLSEAVAAYDLDGDALLDALNDLLGES
jgi:hypothetical protein